MTPSPVKAIALMSGGLDSNLAVRIVHDMGVAIIGVHFTGPFCLCNRGAGGPVTPKPRGGWIIKRSYKSVPRPRYKVMGTKGVAGWSARIFVDVDLYPGQITIHTSHSRLRSYPYWMRLVCQ